MVCNLCTDVFFIANANPDLTKRGSRAWAFFSTLSLLVALVVPCQASAMSGSRLNVGSVQRPIFSCSEQAFTLAPVTSACDIGPFGCHISTTVTTVATSAAPAKVAITNATTTVFSCRYQMVARHQMAFAMGSGFGTCCVS